jgi:hypothetical protein
MKKLKNKSPKELPKIVDSFFLRKSKETTTNDNKHSSIDPPLLGIDRNEEKTSSGPPR